MGHFIKICKYCKKVIEQCRCMDRNKQKIYDVCDECKAIMKQFKQCQPAKTRHEDVFVIGPRVNQMQAERLQKQFMGGVI